MTRPAFVSDSVALVTGAASGIGLAAAKRFAAMGMRLVLVDQNADRLEQAASDVTAAGASDVMTHQTNVADRAEVEALHDAVMGNFGGVDVLMNNAGVGRRTSCLDAAAWHDILDVNLWGAIHGTQVFAPTMIASGRPGVIVNTGSKQGITTPPGSPAYNVSKAALKSFTEALAHELRNTEGNQVTAHLLIPGFVHTGMIGLKEKPPAAWTPEQTVDFFLDSIGKGDFYILCPDNDVPRSLDEKRIAWSVGDIIENRPALSRWHPSYTSAFEDFINS